MLLPKEGNDATPFPLVARSLSPFLTPPGSFFFQVLCHFSIVYYVDRAKKEDEKMIYFERRTSIINHQSLHQISNWKDYAFENRKGKNSTGPSLLVMAREEVTRERKRQNRIMTRDDEREIGVPQ